MARAISKILFILGSYNFLAYLECVRSYAWSKGHSDPDLSSVRPDQNLTLLTLHETIFSLANLMKSLVCNLVLSDWKIYRLDVIALHDCSFSVFKMTSLISVLNTLSLTSVCIMSHGNHSCLLCHTLYRYLLKVS